MESFLLFFRGGTGQEDWSEWISQLKQSGHFVDGALLEKNGKKIKADGAAEEFAFDINENARGYVVLSASNLEEVLHLTKMCPVFANNGHVTVRPISHRF